jgi:hypothetical protein
MLLKSLENHTVATLGTNGFGTDKLVSAIWASVWNIKDLVGIHFELSPGICGIMGIS